MYDKYIGMLKIIKCLNHKGYKYLTVNSKYELIHYGYVYIYHYVGHIAKLVFRRKFNFEDHVMIFFYIMAEMFPLMNSTEF